MSKKILVTLVKVFVLIFAATIISSAAIYILARVLGMTGDLPILAVIVSVSVGMAILIICGLSMIKIETQEPIVIELPDESAKELSGFLRLTVNAIRERDKLCAVMGINSEISD